MVKSISAAASDPCGGGRHKQRRRVSSAIHSAIHRPETLEEDSRIFFDSDDSSIWTLEKRVRCPMKMPIFSLRFCTVTKMQFSPFEHQFVPLLLSLRDDFGPKVRKSTATAGFERGYGDRPQMFGLDA